GGEVASSLATLSSVSEVYPAENGARGWMVSSRPGSDSREEIFEHCVRKGWILTQMTPIESSLEDIFRELTED
ncbi:MAG TPA: hypothetical protein VK074_05485, partial [Fodinibius sp.]|nr:hypothetical protein [Fodinibius sp.]